MAKRYEILITHEEGKCPQLPADLQYLSTGEYNPWKCPVHCVFSKPCQVWEARQVIEKQLFYVQGIQRISLFYGGERKEHDCYERDPLHARRWNHI